MTKETKRESEIIIVLAHDKKQFDYYVKCLQPSKDIFIYGSSVDKMHGIKADDVIVLYGSYMIENFQELKKYAISRMKK